MSKRRPVGWRERRERRRRGRRKRKARGESGKKREESQEVKYVSVERAGEGDSQVCHLDFRKRGALPPAVRYSGENRSTRPHHQTRQTTAGPRHAAATFKVTIDALFPRVMTDGRWRGDAGRREAGGGGRAVGGYCVTEKSKLVFVLPCT